MNIVVMEVIIAICLCIFPAHCRQPHKATEIGVSVVLGSLRSPQLPKSALLRMTFSQGSS